MRRFVMLVLFGACLSGSGCQFVYNIVRNVCNEPKIAIDEKVVLERHERLGKLAWDEMVSQYGCQFSDDYRAGFIDGFVDYLTYGGVAPMGLDEAPVVPAVPPPKYRRPKAMSPEGHQAAEEWFMGFRHGSATAVASGLRQLVTVPVFDRPTKNEDAIPGRYQSLPGRSPNDSTSGQTPAVTTPPEGETLPTPRPVPDGGAVPAPPPPGPAVPPVGPAVPAVPPAGPMNPPAGGTNPMPPPAGGTNPVPPPAGGTNPMPPPAPMPTPLPGTPGPSIPR
jgi:hypothetical protein